MRVPSPTKYVASGEGFIAYRVCGTPPPDLVLVMDWFGHVEEMWSPASPLLPVLEGFASFGRVITFDRRGVGLSDAVSLGRLPTLESWMDDIGAVMDACEIERAAVVAKGSGGPMALLFAASHPERVSSLVLVNSYARLTRSADYPIGIRVQDHGRLLRDSYPPPGSARLLAGGEIDDVTVSWWDRYLRYSAAPAVTRAMRKMLLSVDVREVLGSVRTPTLVLHRRDDAYIELAHGAYLAEHIPGARLVEVPGASDLLFAGDPAELLAEVEEFLTGVRPTAPTDRVLATVLFTDLVGSTKHLARVGDQTWRSVLDQHDHTVRAQLRRFDGREVRQTGDGFLALFDGPARAIRCAHAIRVGLQDLGLVVRAGLHTGEIDMRGDDIGGIAVHIGARIMDAAGPGEVLTSHTVKDLVVGSGLRFDDRGTRPLRGVPDDWQLFAALA
jgi:pimeloyl-ACP methyl ester carboxylesterase